METGRTGAGRGSELLVEFEALNTGKKYHQHRTTLSPSPSVMASATPFTGIQFSAAQLHS